MSKARIIAACLDGSESWRGNGWYECRCPCPDHGKGRGDRRPSLGLKEGDNGRLIIKCQAGCDWRDVAAELRRRDLYKGEVLPTTAAVQAHRVAPQRDLRDYAIKLWRQSISVKSTIAERYLRDVRKITIPIPPTIRFHRRKCALIAAVSNEDHQLLSAQLTFIDRITCTKINRKTFGRMLDGAARLGAATSVLGLAEGLETALSVTELFHLPCWATLGVERFVRVAIPPHVERLHLFADPDAKSLARAEHAARRFRRHVWRVQVHMPDGDGDYNDILHGIKEQAA